MSVIDSQLHEPPVFLEWQGADDTSRQQVLTELQLGLMRAAGVDRAVLFPVDLNWGMAAASEHPDRFGVVPMVTVDGVLGGIDAGAPDLEEILAQTAADPAVVGLRIMRRLPAGEGTPGVVPLEAFDRTITACEKQGLPLFMSTAGDFEAPAQIARRHPDLTVIIDHLGLPQPPTHPRQTPPFKSLPGMLALAAVPNVAAKFSGLPTLSQEPYPFADLWPHLHQVVEAFGPDRLMWGSDISRVQGRIGFDVRMAAGLGPYEGKHSYAEALFYLRETTELSASDKNMILGETAAKLLRWSKD